MPYSKKRGRQTAVQSPLNINLLSLVRSLDSPSVSQASSLRVGPKYLRLCGRTTVATSVLICHGKLNRQGIDMEALPGKVANTYLGSILLLQASLSLCV